MSQRSSSLSAPSGLVMIAALILLLTSVASQSTGYRAEGDGASRGSLIIAGGGSLPLEIKKRFLDLATQEGGAKVLVLPMASGYEVSGPAQAEEFRTLGAAVATSVRLTREEAEHDSSREHLRAVTGVWFTGGDQSRVTAAIGETVFLKALHRLHREGAVLGGTSAGAALMSPLMLTGEEHRTQEDGEPGDQSYMFRTLERDNIVLVRGLGFLPATIVDQHFIRRKRHNRLMSVVLENPDHIGVGIDEATALEVDPDGSWTVLGHGVVVIYDARGASIPSTGPLRATDVRLHVLTRGDRFTP